MTRALLILIGVAGLFLSGAGCSKQEPSSSKPANSSASPGGNPLTAPADYLGAAAQAQQKASKTLSGVGLDQAIKMFYAQEGRFPKDLNELVPSYISSVPPAPRGMKYSYDAQTGAVKVVPQ